MNNTALDLLNQSADLHNRLSDFRDTFTRYTPEWFRADNIHAKAFKRYLRRYDWAFSYNPFKTLYAPQLTESGDSARSSVPVAALPGTGSHQQEGQGSNYEYLHHVDCECFACTFLDVPEYTPTEQRAEQGSGSTPDVRHIEYFDDVEIIHHVICYTVPAAFNRV